MIAITAITNMYIQNTAIEKAIGLNKKIPNIK